MITAIIQNKYDSFTEAEQKVADSVLGFPHEIVNMTIWELGQRSNTAPSAVTRFCRSVGVDGFSSLKILLAKELGSRSEDSFSELPAIQKEDSPKTVFTKVFSSEVKTLNDTLASMDFEQIEKICNIFVHAKHLIFFGIGTSSVIAVDAHYRFTQLGISAASYTDILFMNMAASTLGEGDVAVGISHSGATKATVDALRRAKDAGAKTVAITSFSDSLLAKESDYSVVAYSDERIYPVEAVSARMAHVCIIDAFMMSIAAMTYDTIPEHIAKRNQILSEIRYRK